MAVETVAQCFKAGFVEFVRGYDECYLVVCVEPRHVDILVSFP